jgi:hypothetical protein
MSPTIDFFTGLCANGDASDDVTSSVAFGLCDDPPVAGVKGTVAKRAYIDDATPAKWIAIVDNSSAYTVTFKGVDACIDIRRPDGNLASRCDGILTYEQTIIFVELKERDTDKKWAMKGDGQLRATIDVFSANHSLAAYQTKRAYVANSLRPLFAVGRTQQMEKFKAETGFTLLITNTIVL